MLILWGCNTSSSIVQWLVFSPFFKFFGCCLCVICVSVGLSEYNRDWRAPVLGMLLAVLLFLFTIWLTAIDDGNVDNMVENAVSGVVNSLDASADRRFLRYATFSLASVVFTYTT